MSGVLPPSLAARFEALAVLGAGEAATVLRCRDLDLDREVALKVLRPGADDRVAQRLRREAGLLARLEHPHLVRVLDHGEADGAPYLVLELLAGRSFDHLPEDEGALTFLLQVAGALEALHRAGVVHRDVTPANMILDEGGGVPRGVLCDLGAGRGAGSSSLTRTREVVGASALLAPELLRGGGPTPASDWFAWGVAAYQVIEGRDPFQAAAVLAYAQGGPWPEPDLAGVPPSRQGLYLACLSERPEDRPAGPAALAARIGAGSPEEVLRARGTRELAPPPASVLGAAAAGPAGAVDRSAATVALDGGQVEAARRAARSPGPQAARAFQALTDPGDGAPGEGGASATRGARRRAPDQRAFWVRVLGATLACVGVAGWWVSGRQPPAARPTIVPGEPARAPDDPEAAGPAPASVRARLEALRSRAERLAPPWAGRESTGLVVALRGSAGRAAAAGGPGSATGAPEVDRWFPALEEPLEGERLVTLVEDATSFVRSHLAAHPALDEALATWVREHLDPLRRAAGVARDAVPQVLEIGAPLGAVHQLYGVHDRLEVALEELGHALRRAGPQAPRCRAVGQLLLGGKPVAPELPGQVPLWRRLSTQPASCEDWQLALDALVLDLGRPRSPDWREGLEVARKVFAWARCPGGAAAVLSSHRALEDSILTSQDHALTELVHEVARGLDGLAEEDLALWLDHLAYRLRSRDRGPSLGRPRATVVATLQWPEGSPLLATPTSSTRTSRRRRRRRPSGEGEREAARPRPPLRVEDLWVGPGFEDAWETFHRSLSQSCERLRTRRASLARVPSVVLGKALTLRGFAHLLEVAEEGRAGTPLAPAAPGSYREAVRQRSRAARDRVRADLEALVQREDRGWRSMSLREQGKRRDADYFAVLSTVRRALGGEGLGAWMLRTLAGGQGPTIGRVREILEDAPAPWAPGCDEAASFSEPLQGWLTSSRDSLAVGVEALGALVEAQARCRASAPRFPEVERLVAALGPAAAAHPRDAARGVAAVRARLAAVQPVPAAAPVLEELVAALGSR